MTVSQRVQKPLGYRAGGRTGRQRHQQATAPKRNQPEPQPRRRGHQPAAATRRNRQGRNPTQPRAPTGRRTTAKPKQAADTGPATGGRVTERCKVMLPSSWHCGGRRDHRASKAAPIVEHVMRSPVNGKKTEQTPRARGGEADITTDAGQRAHSTIATTQRKAAVQGAGQGR